MPKKIYLPENADSSGIDITWTPSARRLDIGGWYDSMVGLEPTSMTLAEFFRKLGIKEKDVLIALRELESAVKKVANMSNEFETNS